MALPIEEPIDTRGVQAAQRIEAAERVAADVPGHARARGAHRHEARGVRAAGAQHRRAHQRLRRPAIVAAARGSSTPAFSNPARTISGENSPARGKNSLPSTLMPSARDFLFDHRLELFDHEHAFDRRAMRRSRPSGSGQEAPSLSTLAFGQHFAHVGIAGAGSDDAERLVSPVSQRLMRRGRQVFLQLRLALEHDDVAARGHAPESSRSSPGSRGSRATAAPCASPTATGLRVCDSRVVPRTITRVSNCSEISKASRVRSSASCASLGSSTGTVANWRKCRRVLLVLRSCGCPDRRTPRAPARR